MHIGAKIQIYLLDFSCQNKDANEFIWFYLCSRVGSLLCLTNWIHICRFDFTCQNTKFKSIFCTCFSCDISFENISIWGRLFIIREDSLFFEGYVTWIYEFINFPKNEPKHLDFCPMYNSDVTLTMPKNFSWIRLISFVKTQIQINLFEFSRQSKNSNQFAGFFLSKHRCRCNYLILPVKTKNSTQFSGFFLSKSKFDLKKNDK